MEERIEMIDIKKAEEEFNKYTSVYDMSNHNIERKYWHSYRVMEESKYIAENIHLEKDQIELVSLIGLLHDIGKFEQIKKYGTFRDLPSVDHGDLGVQILQENDLIRKFVSNDEYDDIIMKAIKNHNKFSIEEGLKEEYLLHSKIIRDADKLDIFYEGVEIFWRDPKEIQEIENSVMKNSYYNNFVEGKVIKKQVDQNKLESLIVFVSFIYDLNFKASFMKLKREDYINKILNKFNFKKDDTKKQMEEIRKRANEYIQNKVKDD